MANFQGVTACNGQRMKQGVMNYIEQFEINGEDICVGVSDEQEFEFYGYCWPYIIKKGDEDENDAADEFYEGLRKFVPANGELIIHMVGYEKCAFPLGAHAIVITSKEVKYVDLPS